MEDVILQNYSGAVKRDKRLDIVIGLPASGKSSVVVNRLSNMFCSRVIDTNSIRQELKAYNMDLSPVMVYKEAKKLEYAAFLRCLQAGLNIVLETVGHDEHRLSSHYIDVAKKAGYLVFVHYVLLNRNIAMGRLLERFLTTGIYEEPSLLEKYDNPTDGNRIKAAYESQKGLVDGYSCFDNDVKKGECPKLVEHSGWEVELLWTV